MPAEPMISISYSEAQLAGIRSAMRGIKGGYEKVVVGAINRVLVTMRGRAARALAKAGGYKVGVVRRNSHVFKARRSGKDRAGVHRGKIRFGGTFWAIDQGARQTRKGVTMAGPGGKRFLVPHAFIATMSRFKRQVYVRSWKNSPGWAPVFADSWRVEDAESGDYMASADDSPRVGRTPVRPLKGVPIFTAWAANKAVQAQVEADAGARLKVETQHRMNYLLLKANGGA